MAVPCRILNYAVTLILLAMIAITLWYMLGRPDSIDGVLGDLDVLGDAFDNFTATGGGGGFIGGWENDPFKDIFKNGEAVGNNDSNGTSIALWETNGTGLTLEMWNALDDSWNVIFALAVNDWNNGLPDALSLITKKVDRDKKCKPVDGVMKVCNDDYGETGWLGKFSSDEKFYD